jgi:hypothetical protein
MGEAQNFVFSYREIAESLVKRQGIHEGLWMIYVEFGIGAANVGPNKDQVAPTAIVPIVKMGIQRVEKDNPVADSVLVVDAAVVNPA